MTHEGEQKFVGSNNIDTTGSIITPPTREEVWDAYARGDYLPVEVFIANVLKDRIGEVQETAGATVEPDRVQE